MIYALYESLRIIHEEGLEARFARHVLHSNALKAGLHAMGLKLFAQDGYQAPMLNSVEIPEGWTISVCGITWSPITDWR